MNESAATLTDLPSPASRRFVPADLSISSWAALSPLYESLENRAIASVQDLMQWLTDLSELESAVQEHVGWLYIRMTCDTRDASLSEAYTYFVNEINPHIEPVNDRLNRKLVESPYARQLDRKSVV